MKFIIDCSNEIDFKIDYMHSYPLEIFNIIYILHKIIFIIWRFKLNADLEIEKIFLNFLLIVSKQISYM